MRVARVMSAALAVLEAARDALSNASAEAVVSPRDSAWRAFHEIARNGRGRVAVVDGGVLVGVVTQEELQHALSLDGASADAARRAA